MDLQPVLQNKLVVLRPLKGADFDALYALAKDPLVWEQHQHSDRYRPDVFRAYFDSGMAAGTALAILDAASGTPIGSSRYRVVDAATGVCEIGWSFLGRAYWGGSYNRAFKSLMANHALQYFNTLVFYVHPQNMRSQRAMEKLGAKPCTDTSLSWVRPFATAISFTLAEPILDNTRP